MSILVLSWFGLLGLTIGLFIILDGADLGIGALFPAARDEAERSIMVSAIGPMWYANETWLVIAGAILFGAFPLAYGILLSALYIPAMLLLLGLVLRAVSTEFRVQSSRRSFWSAVFAAGSCLAILAQGFMLGGLLSGLSVTDGLYSGGAWDWLTPTSLIVTAGISSGYVMLGAAHMVWKTEGAIQRRYRGILRVSASVAVAAFIAIAAAVPFLSPAISRIWLQSPRPYITSVLIAGAVLGFVMLLVRTSGSAGASPEGAGESTAQGGREKTAPERRIRAWALIVFICCACAIVSAIFPYFIPLSVTIQEAAAPAQTLVFMLIGASVIIPTIAVYNLYARGIFRGKVRGGDEEEY